MTNPSEHTGQSPENVSTLLADLRELNQRLLAANERLMELRDRRTGAPRD
ncbi:MAG: hypothetical protein JO040_11620 [Gemmatimonadetes bacterium]|nr:hypothetical protein [Gemmatimonadota bacterium]